MRFHCTFFGMLRICCDRHEIVLLACFVFSVVCIFLPLSNMATARSTVTRMFLFMSVYAFVCILRSPPQKILKSQSRASTRDPRTRHPLLRTPRARYWSLLQVLILRWFPSWRSQGLGRPRGSRGGRGWSGRSRHHRKKRQQWSTFPWQWWNWRACWTPQNFPPWVLRDTGQGQVSRLNKVNPKSRIMPPPKWKGGEQVSDANLVELWESPHLLDCSF